MTKGWSMNTLEYEEYLGIFWHSSYRSRTIVATHGGLISINGWLSEDYLNQNNKNKLSLSEINFGGIKRILDYGYTFYGEKKILNKYLMCGELLK